MRAWTCIAEYFNNDEYVDCGDRITVAARAGCLDVTDLQPSDGQGAELRRLNRLYAALTQINQTIVRLPSREELFQQICRIFVEQAGFRMAWIGWHDPDSRRLLPVAACGDADRYLTSIAVYADDRPEGRGPTGRAFREGRPQICNDLSQNPDVVPWRQQLLNRGFEASASLPIRVGGEIAGTLSVYAGETGFFQDREIALLEEAATDTSFALDNMIRASEHAAALEAVRRMNADLEQRVSERTAQLAAANRELESFSYSVSHDLRAPLRAINGFAGIVLEDFAGSLPDAARAHLERIRLGGQRMGALIDDLLALARLNRKTMHPQPVDMTALARDALGDLQDQCAGRELEIRLDPLPPALGDPGLLKQVWVNLLSNAVKYTRGRAPALIEVRARADGDRLIYQIKDNGTGFDMKYAHKLFGVFQRLHRDDQFEGTGVGLAIVQRIIHRHGGQVWADAEVDRGARFCFTVQGRG